MSEGGTAHPADAAARPAPALDVVVAGLLFEDLVFALTGPRRNDWLAEARAAGSTVFADVGWDPTGAWDAAVLDQLEHCDVFTPNAGEACTTPGPPHRTTPSSASRTWCPSRSCRSVPDTCSRPASSPRRCGTCRWRGDWPSRTRSPCCR